MLARLTSAVACCTLALFPGGIMAQQAPQRKPNIVVIMADDLGYGDLGCYGSREIRTPHLDGLARRGVRLTDAYANAAVCSPTRAALITGRYPQRAGFDWVIDYGETTRGLAATPNSLPRLLKNAGYRTGLVGKWHLGYRDEWGPNAHGFSHFFGFLAADIDYYAHTEANGEPGVYENTQPAKAEGYFTDVIAEHAAGFVKAGGGEPFFLLASFNAPHWPFQPPDAPDDVRNSKTYGPRTGTRADYVKMVERLDAGIGRILTALADAKLESDTLVIFFSDNGGERLSDNGPLFHGKYTLWEGGIRVPAIVCWPGVIAAGGESPQPVITTDITASILAAAGAAIPESPALDGENVLPILAGQAKPRERTFFWRVPTPERNRYVKLRAAGDADEVPEPPMVEFQQKAVRRGQWKYLLDGRVELLFDLSADVGERRNVAYRHPERVAELRSLLAAWEKTLPAIER